MRGMLTVVSGPQPAIFTTLATVKADLALDPGDTSQDAWLTTLIKRASASISAALKGRVLGQGSYMEVFAPENWDRDAMQERLTHLLLSRYPITALASIVDRRGVAIDPAHYFCSTAGVIRQVRVFPIPVGTIWLPLNLWFYPVTVSYTAGYDLVGNLPGDLDAIASQLVQTAFLSRGRDPAIQMDETANVGSYRYFDTSAQPGGAMVITPAMEATLSRYTEQRV